MKSLICMMVAIVFVLTGVEASAAIVSYSSNYDGMDAARNDWLSGLGIASPDHTIDFETGFVHDQDVLGAVLDGGLTITSPAGYAYVTNSSGDLGGSLPVGVYALAVDEGDAYTFSFVDPVSYFAIYNMDNDNMNMEVHYSDGTSDVVTLAYGGASGHKGNFLALDFDKVVDYLYIPRVNGGDGEVGIDNIEFGYIPEPATMTLLALGAVSLLRRRR